MKKLTLFLALMASAFVNNPVDAQKTVNLFNGKDLSNWDFVVEGNKVPFDPDSRATYWLHVHERNLQKL